MYQSDSEDNRPLIGQPDPAMYEVKPAQYDDLAKEYRELSKEYPAESPLKDEHYLFTGWNGIYQGTFGGFIWLARFLNSKVKFYMASASIPVEVINFLIVMKKVVGREKPWAIFVGIVLPLLALIGTMVLVDLVRFGVIASGPLAAIAGAGPFIFTGALALFGALNTLRAIDTAKECWAAYKNGTLTYLHKVRLASRITKSAALFALSGLIAPFMLATVANPFGAILFAAAITAVLVTVVAMKIWKTVQENREWTETLKTLHATGEDPYEVLGVDLEKLNGLVEKKNSQSGFTKLINMFSNIKYTLIRKFGTAEQIANIPKNETPSSYLRECAAKSNAPHYYELIRKQRGRDMYQEYLWKKTFHDLKSQDPYEFLGFKHEEVYGNQKRIGLLAKEKPVGRIKRFFGMVPKNDEINQEITAKHKEYIETPGRTAQELKLAKRVLDMLLLRKGREKHKEYIATQTKNGAPTHATPLVIGVSRDEVREALNETASGDVFVKPRGNKGDNSSHTSSWSETLSAAQPWVATTLELK